MKLTVYTDGSYLKDTNRCGYAAVFLDEDMNVVNVLYGGFTPKPDENGWNINGELRAAEEGAKAAFEAGADEIVIRHDCDGVGMWAQKKWKRNKSYTIAFAEHMEKLAEKMDIQYESVKGHSTDRFNREADKAARKGAELQDDEMHWNDATAWERFASSNFYKHYHMNEGFSKTEEAENDSEKMSQKHSEEEPQTSTAVSKLNAEYGFEIVQKEEGITPNEFLLNVCTKAGKYANLVNITFEDARAVIFYRN